MEGAEFRCFLDIALGSLTELGYSTQQSHARFLTWKLYAAVARLPKRRSVA